ncbi:MAG: tetratricopeptide repeat protein [Desulfobulbaceae bacterium]
MDRLDKWTAFFVLALSCYATVLLISANGTSQAKEDEKRSQEVRQHVLTPELDSKIQTAKNLLRQENLEKSEALVTTLLGEFPYEGELYMLKGDILVRRQQPVAAMYEYKEAIQLNPDFLDKKTKQFQGKKIKVTVEEAMAAIESGLRKDPEDSKLRNDQKTLYFMKRKLAGSCG